MGFLRRETVVTPGLLCKCRITAFQSRKRKYPPVSFHYAKSNLLSQQMGAGGVRPRPPPVVCGTGASPAPRVPLDLSARGPMTRLLNETPLHLHICMDIEERGPGETSCTCSGSSCKLWGGFLFCFSKQLKNKLIGKKNDGTNWCVFSLI